MIRILALTMLANLGFAGDQAVSIQFRAMVGAEELACGKSFGNIGTTKSTITPRDFRFYVHNVRLLNEQGNAVLVDLKQDGKWQLDNVALLDFEDASGSCRNGTPEMNVQVTGTVPEGRYRGVQFTLGVPFEKNHTELTKMPPPLNLTALAWVWNAGRKFARLDFSSTGVPRGYAVHLGSTGCTPNDTQATVPTKCSEPNRLEVELPQFDLSTDAVVADLAALLQDSNVDEGGKMMSGCMSGPATKACGPLFSNLGLAFPGQPTVQQRFFRKAAATGTTSARRD